MQHFVDACLALPGHSRTTVLLARIVPIPALHARLLNTLSRLEYVGVRKMLKARRAESLDLEGLQHILEEAVHAVRLKKFAVALANERSPVTSYTNAHTLAGDAAEAYFQTVDRGTSELLPECDPEIGYRLTSAAIEIRARSFYPAYQAVLARADSRVSVASILQDEDEHLEQIAAALPRHLPEWRGLLTQLMALEERAFAVLLDALEHAVEEWHPQREGFAESVATGS